MVRLRLDLFVAPLLRVSVLNLFPFPPSPLFPTLLLAAIAYIPMIAEAIRSVRNERKLRQGGAFEPAGDVYGAMQVIYPACFAAMIAEFWVRGGVVDAVTAIGGSVFGAAKVLKYWAIGSLGDRWTFRVLVPPGSQRVVRGPYAFIRHPNYVAVVGELLGMALLAHAPLTGAASLVLFGALLRIRIRVEEGALGLRPSTAGEHPERVRGRQG